MRDNGNLSPLSPVPPPDSPVVLAENLTRALPLGGVPVNILNGVSFSVARGEWIALTGPSGSGKSTLLGLIAGLDTPSSGRIVIDGTDITGLDEGALARLRNQKIGIVFQSFNLIPNLTAQENVELPLYVRSGSGAVEQARQMLDLVGLRARRRHRPSQLSGGEQQRVAIARALVTRPALLVADEPTGNLDSKTGAQVLDLFESLHRELGVTLIIATHDPQVAARADRVLHMVDGRLAADADVPLLAGGAR